MKRRALLLSAGLGGAIGLVAFASAIVASLQPSARTDAALPRLPTADIAPGTYRFVPDIYEDRLFRGEVLLVRDISGRLMAWYIPGRNGVRSLPDGHWWRPGNPCPDLRPDFTAGVIACFDPAAPDWLRTRYRWSLEGKALSDQVPHMEPVPGVEESGYFVFHKRSAA